MRKSLLSGSVVLALCFAGAAVLPLFTGCSSAGSGFGDGGDTDGSVVGEDGGFKIEGGGDGSACGTRCSSDLHDVVDCNGAVLKTCPADQACGAGGQCVAACDGARDNKSSIGCDYWVWDPDVIPEGNGACFAAYIANTWTDPVTITVERAGQTLNVAQAARIPSGNGQSISYAPLPNGQLPPGQVAIVFLNRYGSVLTDCPGGVTPAYSAGYAATLGTGIGTGMHITTSRPVVAYDIFPYGGGASAATSATLLLPTSAWDTNYIGVNAYRKSTAVVEAQPAMAIMAQEDGTDVTISPTAAIVGGSGVPGTAKGMPRTYTLQRGQYLQLTQDVELSGSAIQSTKPVGLWAGASCLNIDVGASACDSAHQQIPPVKALGREYVGVRYRNRTQVEETPPWRVIGAVDGTALTWEPTAPQGAPLSINQGQVFEFPSAGPFVVRSQDDKHPFYLSAHMTGGGNFGGTGDPEFVNVIPPEQYLASYVFFTDPTYPETNLVVIRKKGPSGFADVNLDCAGNLSGWQPIGGSGNYEYTRVDLVTGNFQKVGACDNGRHEMKSNAPFGLTVWGWGTSASFPFSSQYVSYAYPAGASVQPVNTVVVPPTPK